LRHKAGSLFVVALSALVALTVGPAGAATTASKPKVTSFSPSSGAPGTSVKIKGSNLTGATAVKFNGTPAQSFTVNSTKQVTAVVAAGTTTGKVSVTTPGGTATSSKNFKVTSPPVPPTPQITSFSPTTSAAFAPVLINGAGFTGATGVSFNSKPAFSYAVISDSQIKAWLASGTTSGPITVTTPTGTLTSPSPLTVAYLIELAACQRQPNVVFPVLVGTPIWFGTGWEMTDSSFLAQFLTNTKTTLTVNGTKVKSPAAFWDATGLPGTTSGWRTRFNYDPKITMTSVAQRVTASFQVTATKTLQDGFETYPTGTNLWPSFECTVFGAPLATFSSFAPTSGPVGTPVTITGQNLVLITGIRFGGVEAPVTHVNNTTLTTQVPVGAATGPITLRQGSQATISSTQDFVVKPSLSLSVTSFSPQEGMPGDTVRIDGTGLLRVASVKFGGTAATNLQLVSDTLLTVRVPAGAHTGPIEIGDGTDTAQSDTFTVLAPVGSLDKRFSSDGLLDFRVGAGRTEQLRALTVDGDDRIVAVGLSTAPGVPASSGPAITRLLPDGTFDSTFDGDGKLVVDLPSARYFKAGDVAIDGEGRILVSGSIDTRDSALPDGGAQLAVLRFVDDGSLDTSFGTGGVVTFGFLSCGVVGPVRVALQDDGKIVAAAGACNRTGIVRFGSDGSLDTSFDHDGWLLTGPSSALLDVGPKDLLIQPDGKILVAGGAYDTLAGNKLFVLRITSDGAADATFATGGTFLTTAPERSIAFDLGLDSAGRIVIAGSPLLDRALYVLGRLTSGGTLDPTYGAGGWTDTSFETWVGGNGARALAIATDGKVLATGAALVGRWTSAGILDTSFGTDGRTIVGGTYWIDAALLSDGSLVIGGRRAVDSGFFFARVVTGRTVVP
jgi:uncharacterized delta-60 repeat protein